MIRNKMVKISALTLGALIAPISLANHTSEHAIAERLKPVGLVKVGAQGTPETTVAATPVLLGPDAGKTRYQTSCIACHGTGVAGAPKLGDRAAWTPRIAKGVDVLVQHSIQGFNAMPPKGTCMTCSDEELKLTVEYMISQSK